jgi:apolipoprotein N-acyltransferase
MQKIKTRRLALAALALAGGALLGIGFFIPLLWPLSLVGIAPLLVCATDRRLSWRTAALLGWLAGCAMYSLAIFGVSWGSLPIAWLPRDALALQYAFVFAGWALTSAAMGLSVGLWSFAVRFLATDTWLDIAYAAAAWVVLEVAASYLWLGLNWGPGGVVGPHFTLGSIGYQLASSTVLLQAAWLGGVYALSALAILIGAALWRLLTTSSVREHRALCAAAVVGVALWSGGQFFFALHPTEQHARAALDVPHATFAVLATRLGGSAYDPVKNLAQQEDLLRYAAGTDMVVLPEGSELLLKLSALGQPMPGGAGFYIDSLDVRGADGTLRTRVDYYDARSGTTTVSTYKRFLLPFGEYMPYLWRYAGALLGLGNSDAFKSLASRAHAPGGPPGVVAAPSGAVVGVLLCSESLSPTMYRTLARGGANVLVSASSQLWFNQSRAVFVQMQHAAAVRAVESRRWFVDASNATPAFVLDEYGRVAGETPWAQTGVIRLAVPLLFGNTPYDIMGMYVLAVPLLVLLHGGGRRIAQARSRRA